MTPVLQKKICMLGGFSVGKTSLVKRFVESVFSETYLTTVGVKIDNWARLKLIVKTALLHRRETEAITDEPPTEMFFDWEPEG